ncbi:MAG: hypothetical protein CM1200mP28_10890 [Deltaproteobacteria bacterium]|nr:MAG: hypothetical protein CM1200mP28_10890 [Deltaproteobacteria bacterium]
MWRWFKVSCESIFVPNAVISLAVKGKNNEQHMKMSKALGRFTREDPNFHVATDEESGDTVISGMGELHLDIYIERMCREYGIDVIVGAPQVNYREAITNGGFDYLHKKQTGGAGQFAGVNGSVEPLPLGNEEGFEFVNKILEDQTLQNMFRAREKGFRDVMEKGPLGAFPMVNIRVTLNEGKYHEVDSRDLAFQLASRYAMRQAVEKAIRFA